MSEPQEIDARWVEAINQYGVAHGYLKTTPDGYELTNKALERQSEVDNEIFGLFNSLLGSMPVLAFYPGCYLQVDWNIDPIAEVRDTICDYLKDALKLKRAHELQEPGVDECERFEMHFYPFIAIS
jgi:hypothetical protein